MPKCILFLQNETKFHKLTKTPSLSQTEKETFTVSQNQRALLAIFRQSCVHRRFSSGERWQTLEAFATIPLVVNFERRKLINSVEPVTTLFFFREPGIES
jgi:hypothetical protein